MIAKRDLKVPGVGRLGVYREPSGNGIGVMGGSRPQGYLTINVIRDGKYLKAKDVMSQWSRFWGNIRGNDTTIDLGTGLVTNVGVLAMAEEAVTLASPSGARINILFLSNNHASGTGATAAAATDIKIQTISTNGGQTPVAGTQSLVSAANSQAYRTVATINYTGSEAVTEWGLFASSTLSSTTGSPFTAATATSWTDTGSAQTASSSTVQGLQQSIVIPGTTTVWGLNTSNTTHVAQVPAWYKVSDGTAGSTPGNTETFTIRPVMWDHKVFSAVNVNNGDSIQYTYTLTINSGG